MDWDVKDTVLLGGLILTICGWIAQYRFSIRSKKRDVIVQIINEIREIAKEYINDIFERLNNANNLKKHPPKPGQLYSYVGYLSNPNPSKLIKDIELITIRNSHIIGPFKRWKINKKIKKIADFSTEIYNAKEWNGDLHDKYRKLFYKYLNSIGVYD